ncbi:hypothetical protein KVT40_001092 [Elsinoe batatas]|uniref:Quinate repressor protein n=1 Tax=Elsinoe batatas TaxID=2601811 RepID=A0A8K0PKW8_9PEZI|nr:hypothetical protein KVT40_001092 [Elsinoe batatas]
MHAHSRSTPAKDSRPATKRRRRDDTAATLDLLSTSHPVSSSLVADETLHNQEVPASQPMTESASIIPSEANAVSQTAGADVSFVLVGSKGSGLSTLAVIAARALKYRTLDVDALFKKRFELSMVGYIRQHGKESFRNKIASTLIAITNQYDQGHIIVCGAEALESSGQAILQDYAKLHPVILVNRDPTIICKYLGVPATRDVLRMMEQSQKIYRQLSSYEFYNIEEEPWDATLSARLSLSLGRYHQRTAQRQILRKAKENFVRFLRNLTRRGDDTTGSLYPTLPELRPYSNALQLPVACVAKGSSPGWLSSIDYDAIELIVAADMLYCDVESGDRLSLALQMIRQETSAPVIFHVVHGDVQSKTKYLRTIQFGIRLLPEFVTIDLDCEDQELRHVFQMKEQIRLIGHTLFEQLDWTSNELMDKVDRALDLGCHIIRFVKKTNSPIDEDACRAFAYTARQRTTVPIIAYNTGVASRRSAIFNDCLSPVTSAHIPAEPGRPLISVPERHKALFASFVYQPLRFYIFGASVNYSLSPSLHNAGFRAIGMPHEYGIRQSKAMNEFLGMVDESFGGASVSLPFKSDIVCLLDSLSEAARIIQAVNTVLPARHKCYPSGPDKHECQTLRNTSGTINRLHGENTDWLALYTCVTRHLSTANAISTNTAALVIGAGGMARAALYALIKLGVKRIVMWNRTHDRALKVAEHFMESCALSGGLSGSALSSRQTSPPNDLSIQVVHSLEDPWPQGVAQPTIVMCTIPAHQTDDQMPPNFTIPKPWFQSQYGGVVVELSYKAPWTPLLQQVCDHSERGWTIVEPLEVLTEQAYAQFELFTGKPAPRKIMEKSAFDNYVKIHGDAAIRP